MSIALAMRTMDRTPGFWPPRSMLLMYERSIALREFFLRDALHPPAPPNGSAQCNKHRVVCVSG